MPITKDHLGLDITNDGRQGFIVGFAGKWVLVRYYDTPTTVEKLLPESVVFLNPERN